MELCQVAGPGGDKIVEMISPFHVHCAVALKVHVYVVREGVD